MPGLDQRASVVAVDSGAAVTRYVLDDREHATLDQTLAHRSGEARHTLRVGPVGAVADHRIGSGCGQVEYRKASDGDAEPSKVVGDQAGAEPGRMLRGRVG